MSSSIFDGVTKSVVHSQTVGRLPDIGHAITAGAQSSDLIGNASYDEINLLVVPTTRLTDDFFNLSTGLAGEIIQKAANYHVRLAIIGDVAPYVNRSKAFADFVRETNKGNAIWFVPDNPALEAKLAV